MLYAPTLTHGGSTLSSANLLRRLHLAAPPAPTLLIRPLAPPKRTLNEPRIVRCFGSSIAVLQDVGATASVVGGAYVLVSTFDNLTRRRIIEQNLSRKLVHIFSGLIFLASWPIFRHC